MNQSLQQSFKDINFFFHTTMKNITTNVRDKSEAVTTVIVDGAMKSQLIPIHRGEGTMKTTYGNVFQSLFLTVVIC